MFSQVSVCLSTEGVPWSLVPGPFKVLGPRFFLGSTPISGPRFPLGAPQSLIPGPFLGVPQSVLEYHPARTGVVPPPPTPGQVKLWVVRLLRFLAGGLFLLIFSVYLSVVFTNIGGQPCFCNLSVSIFYEKLSQKFVLCCQIWHFYVSV